MKTYSFYEFLQVRLNYNGHRGYERYFDNEYTRIVKGQKAEECPLITVSIVKKLPEPQAGDLVRAPRYKKLFTYKFLVRNLFGNHVEIFFENHPVDKVYMNAIGVFLQAQVLEPIMYLKLLESGVLFMHAGGVAKDGYGYLLPAHGGTGKTTFSIALMNHGFQLLGDDLLIVDTKKRLVYPYPRPMHLFTYNINNLNGANIPLKYKTAIYTKNGMRYVLERVLRTEFLISTRVHADEIFSGELFAKPVPYKGVYFLRKEGKASEPRVITKRSAVDIAAEIMISEDLNDSLYEILEDEAQIAKVKELERKIIVNLLSQFSNITYVNTRKLDLTTLDPFIAKVFEKNKMVAQRAGNAPEGTRK
jgi:hypothetical protein